MFTLSKMEEEEEQEMDDVIMEGKTAGLCQVCQRAGKKNYLKVYQINFDEAITFCEDDTCTYPLGLDDPADSIHKRNFTDIKNSPQRPQITSLKKGPSSQQKTVPPKQAICLKFSGKEKVLAPYVTGRTLGNGTSIGMKKETKEVAMRTVQYVPSNSVQNSSGTVRTPQCVPSSSVQNTNGGESVSQCRVSSSKQNDVEGVNGVNKDSQEDSSIFYGISHNGLSLHSMLYPQWQNKDALCWLDVIMCLLVHSRHLQTVAAQSVCMSQENQSVLFSLVKAYSQACKLINFSKKETLSTDKLKNVSYSKKICQTQLSSVVMDSEERKVVKDLQNLTVKDESVKTGAGLSLSSDFNDNMSLYMTEEYQKAFMILNDYREMMFEYLQPKLKCSKGKNDSPVFAIPLLVRGNSCLEEMMKMKYSFQLVCNQCGFCKVDKYDLTLPTFPNTVRDFQMSSPAFDRPCFKCSAPNQQRVMVYERLSDVVMIHFVKGLPFNDLSALDFTFNGRRYTVTGLVQYRNDPDHFVTWIRDSSGTMWLEYDDLKSPVCQFKSMSLGVPASQIHIVLWEASGKSNSEFMEPHGQTESQLKSNHLSSLATIKGNSVSEIKLSEVDGITGSNCVSIEESQLEKYENDTTESMDVHPGTLGHNDEKLVSDPGNENAMDNTMKIGSTLVQVMQKSKMTEGRNSDLTKGVKNPLPTQGLMMVAFTPDGKLVPTSMLNLLNITNPNAQVRNISNVDSNNYPYSFKSLSESSEPKVVNVRGRQHRRDMGASSHDTPRFASNQINLLRSLKTKKNSLVKDIEAEGMQTEIADKKQTLARQNSSAKSSAPLENVKTSCQYIKTNGTRKNMSHQNFSFQGKKFASYKTEREVQRQSSCSPVSEISDYSAPCSPAFSCHSDGVLFQKRKSDSCISYDKADTKNRKKQRKSELLETEKFMNELLKVDDSRSLQEEIRKPNEECDVLKDLYSALNMPLPSEASLDSKKINVAEMDPDDLPDVNNLASFINDDTAKSLDEFLAQL